jgi:hypothetical protein
MLNFDGYSNMDGRGLARIRQSQQFPITPGSAIGNEGVPLVKESINGIEHVHPSTGDPGEDFIGVSYSAHYNMIVKTKVEKLTVPGATPEAGTETGKITLRPHIVTGQITIYDITASAFLTKDDTVASGKYKVTDLTGIVEFHADEQDHELKITYRYAPTQLELTIDEDISYVIPHVTEEVGLTGVIMRGANNEIYTDQFDASVQWTPTTEVRLGEAVFTSGDSSATLVDVDIIGVPDVNEEFLGLRFKG